MTPNLICMQFIYANSSRSSQISCSDINTHWSHKRRTSLTELFTFLQFVIAVSRTIIVRAHWPVYSRSFVRLSILIIVIETPQAIFYVLWSNFICHFFFQKFPACVCIFIWLTISNSNVSIYAFVMKMGIYNMNFLISSFKAKDWCISFSSFFFWFLFLSYSLLRSIFL